MMADEANSTVAPRGNTDVRRVGGLAAAHIKTAVASAQDVQAHFTRIEQLALVLLARSEEVSCEDHACIRVMSEIIIETCGPARDEAEAIERACNHAARVFAGEA